MKQKGPKTVRATRAERELIGAATEVRKNSYAPYSRFQVGAALSAPGGKVFAGCNLENASFGATLCAERNALARAVASGSRSFDRLAIVTGSSPPSPPCGLCLQALVEFCEDLVILLANSRGELVRTRLSKLLPLPFSGRSL